MRFNDHDLQNALGEWRRVAEVLGLSEADNLWFEQRVSPVRQQAFEDVANGAADASALRPSASRKIAVKCAD